MMKNQEVLAKLETGVRRLTGESDIDHLLRMQRLSTEEVTETIFRMAHVIAGMVSDKQMRALEYHISTSADATDYTKRAIIWMLRQTNNLARNIAVSFSDEWHSKYPKEIALGVHDMESSNRTTHTDVILRAMGVEKCISSHFGLYRDGKLDKSLPGHTVWVAKNHYDDTAEVLQPDFAAIEATDLSSRAILGNSFWKP